MASAIPVIPKRFPRRADSCAERPLRERMKRSAAARYATVTKVWGMAAALPVEHAQHPLRHGEAADDVDGRQEDRDRAEHEDGGGDLPARLVHPADHDDAADRVG